LLLPWLAQGDLGWWRSLDGFYRSGALVFGGGHVVLPLLEQEFVPALVDREVFLAGYGAAQAVPGPLFTFASFLGASSPVSPRGWTGGAWATMGVFLPSLLLVYGALPWWQRLRTSARMQAALRGTNAVVVGLLLAALYDPVWQAGIKVAPDLALGLLCFVGLQVWRLPTWVLIPFAALVAQILGP
jgi:chromate transporter